MGEVCKYFDVDWKIKELSCKKTLSFQAKIEAEPGLRDILLGKSDLEEIQKAGEVAKIFLFKE